MGRKRKEPTEQFRKNLYNLLGQDESTLKITLKKINDETGITPSAIRKWLNGQRDPRKKKLQEVAKCVGFTLSEVFDENPPEDKQSIIVSSTHRVDDRTASSGG